MAHFQCLSALAVRAVHSDTTGLWHTENPNEDNTKQTARGKKLLHSFETCSKRLFWHERSQTLQAAM